MKLGIGRAVSGVVVAEFFPSQDGLGNFIFRAGAQLGHQCWVGGPSAAGDQLGHVVLRGRAGDGLGGPRQGTG
jgi:hypothetical protein